MLRETERATEQAGEALAHRLGKRRARRQAVVIALTGELGAGKTVFLRGFARGLGIRRRIVSPTFILARRYRIPKHEIRSMKSEIRNKSQVQNSKLETRYFWHIDAYRLRESKDLSSIGFSEIIADARNVVAIEWADRVRSAVPKDAVWVSFRHHPRGRDITFRRQRK